MHYLHYKSKAGAAIEAIHAQNTVSLDELVFVAVRLYIKALSIYAFVDGNGRTTFTLLQYALVRCSLACWPSMTTPSTSWLSEPHCGSTAASHIARCKHC